MEESTDSKARMSRGFEDAGQGHSSERTSSPPGPLSPTDRAAFVNRELSWMEFNQRVLDEARNPAVPLLERLKFLSIVNANLDEFFMVRVAGLFRQHMSAVSEVPADGMRVEDQLCMSLPAPSACSTT